MSSQNKGTKYRLEDSFVLGLNLIFFSFVQYVFNIYSMSKVDKNKK